MFCTNCGKEIHPDAIICVHCGTSTKNNSSQKVASGQDDGSAWWLILGLLMPVIGLVLYLVWKDEKPLTANQLGKGALIGVIVSVVFTVFTFVLSFIFPFFLIPFMYI